MPIDWDALRDCKGLVSSDALAPADYAEVKAAVMTNLDEFHWSAKDIRSAKAALEEGLIDGGEYEQMKAAYKADVTAHILVRQQESSEGLEQQRHSSLGDPLLPMLVIGAVDPADSAATRARPQNDEQSGWCVVAKMCAMVFGFCTIGVIVGFGVALLINSS